MDRGGTRVHSLLMSATRTLTRVASIFASACLGFTAALFAAPGATASPRVQPCIWPSTGTNLQQFFGVSVSLVIPSACPPIKAGSQWATPEAFNVARSWVHVPAGYQTNGATPLEELENDLTMVRFIVDEGTPHQFTVERPASQIHFQVRDWQEVYPADPDWVFVDIGTHVTMAPLSVGTHTVRGEFAVSRWACDGTSSDVNQSCIPPRVFGYPSRTFTVVP